MADDLADALGGGVGVVFQLGEIALVFGGDALAEIALGERAEHPDKVAQRLCDVVAQRIDRGADIENEAGLAFKRNALGEVAGDRGLDDAAD